VGTEGCGHPAKTEEERPFMIGGSRWGLLKSKKDLGGGQVTKNATEWIRGEGGRDRFQSPPGGGTGITKLEGRDHGFMRG